MKSFKKTNNQAIAKLFESVAAALIIKKSNHFKIVAYERAAIVAEHATSELRDLWGKDQLTSLPGIGVNIAQHLDELFRTGKVNYFNQIFKSLPKAMFELLVIPGIGPKTAYKLCQALGIRKTHKAIKKLARAAQDGEIQVLEGFGVESEKDILRGIQELKNLKTDRMLLNKALFISQEIKEYLEKDKNTLKVEVLGSLRRRKATVGDIDLAVASKKPQKTIDYFLNFPKIEHVLAKGSKKASVVLFNNQQVDLRAQPEASFGALLQYFTGSKEHNINLRTLAQKKGLSLSEYGIKTKTGLKKFKTEEDFYKFIGLDWIPPQLREGTEEIQAAIAHKLPELVQLQDIKGDLHVHSDYQIETSHDLGESSFKQLTEKAALLNYQYLALADHSPSVSQHTPAKIIDLMKRRKEYFDQQIYSREKWLKERGLKVLISLEIDILSDGKLAIPAKAFDYLDFGIVSVHSSFRLSKKKMTERVIQALTTHPKIKILAHPTGRILNKRGAYELDWDQLFDVCQKQDKYLEINAFPDRLDLSDLLVREAIKQGVGLFINSDSHNASSLENMIYGVYVAQRGWAEKKDIFNCLPWNQLRSILKVDK